MVLGSVAFAALRRLPLPVLLFFSTAAVGAGYLGLAVAPTLAVACAASVLGGAGNGVQWVAVVSAVQELTAQRMQARVISVLESIGAAMPGVGYLIGGLVGSRPPRPHRLPRRRDRRAGGGRGRRAAAAPRLDEGWAYRKVGRPF